MLEHAVISRILHYLTQIHHFEGEELGKKCGWKILVMEERRSIFPSVICNIPSVLNSFAKSNCYLLVLTEAGPSPKTTASSPAAPLGRGHFLSHNLHPMGSGNERTLILASFATCRPCSVFHKVLCPVSLPKSHRQSSRPHLGSCLRAMWRQRRGHLIQ